MAYTAHTWKHELEGISAAQIEQHLALYNGYVTNTNKLNDQIALLIREGKGNTPECAEQKRRLGFEYNGMRLHEYYFDNLGGKEALSKESTLGKKLAAQFGSYETWEADFKNTGLMRGIGWAILYQDPTNGSLLNCWISDHENGHPAGFTPILVMDVWEHAYTVDWKPTERGKYVEAFMKNVKWNEVEKRLR